MRKSKYNLEPVDKETASNSTEMSKQKGFNHKRRSLCLINNQSN